MARLPRSLSGPLTLVASAAALTFPAGAAAATITVGSGGDDAPAAADDGDCTLREAVEAARIDAAVDACPAGQLAAADTVVISVPTVTLDETGTGEDSNADGDLDVNGGSAGLTITGGATRKTVDGAGIERVFDVHGGAVTFDGLTIRGGDSAADGGGIRASAVSQVTVSGSELSANSARAGGAIANSGSLTVSASALTGNTATDGGGAVSEQSGSFAISDATISGNSATAGSGGGIDIIGVPGALTVERSLVSSNDAGMAGGTNRIGGGIAARPIVDATLTVTGSTIEGNDAFRQGGGIALTDGAALEMTRSRVAANRVLNTDSGAVAPAVAGGGLSDSATFAPTTISDSAFTGNTTSAGADTASNLGGGAKLSGTSTVVRSTFSGNAVSGGEAGDGPRGGGIAVASGSTTLLNVTVSGNSAVSPGGDAGGVDTGSGSGTVRLYSVTLAGNDAADLGDGILALGRVANLQGSVVADGCEGGLTIDMGGNAEAADSCGLGDGSLATLALGQLADNGGDRVGAPGSQAPRLTHALGTGSAAIDLAGACTDQAGSPLTTDGRGFPRPLDGDGANGAACDAGAFEKAAFVPPKPPDPPAQPPKPHCRKGWFPRWGRCIQKPRPRPKHNHGHKGHGHKGHGHGHKGHGHGGKRR